MAYLNPNEFGNFNRTEPFPAVQGASATTGFDYFNRTEPFRFILANAGGGPISGAGQGSMMLVLVG